MAGLERGEAFSVVTSPGAGGQDVKSFESPRFTTVSAGAGQEQNLGEVMVHPVQDPGEIMNIYGDNDLAQMSRLSGFLPSPSAEGAAAARLALARYQAALKSGDSAALQELTSRLSPGWSANRQEFSGALFAGDSERKLPARFGKRPGAAAGSPRLRAPHCCESAERRRRTTARLT